VEKEFIDIFNLTNRETIIPNFNESFFLEKDEIGNLLIATSFIEFSAN